MRRVLSVLLILTFLKILHWLFVHETVFKLSSKMKNHIRKNGLVHYTTAENAKKIISENKLLGALDKKSTFPSHRTDKIIWFMYDADSVFSRSSRWSILRRHSPKIHCGSNHTVRYEVKLHIRGFTENQIENMKYNMEFGIGCYAKYIDNVIISLAQLDDIDRTLGLKDDLL